MRGPRQFVSEVIGDRIDKAALKLLSKYAELPGGDSGDVSDQGVTPPYDRQFPPAWIYKIRKDSSLVNNAIEEKVNQTLRRGFDDWKKSWEAKCPNCEETYGSDEPFRNQVDHSIPEDSEIDFDSERTCPNCGEMVLFETPESQMLKYAQDFFARCNHREDPTRASLEPDDHPSVGQSFLEVLRELAWDIQSFDNGWLLLDRNYALTSDGQVSDYDIRGVYRAPPEQMRYSSENGIPGGEYYVCLECRENDSYSPEEEPVRCSECHSVTYEVFAYSTSNAGSGGTGGDPDRYFIRGEFLHASEYEPSKFYGYPPIQTLFEEARTLEQMDSWYQSAYEKRRAPRAAVAVKGGNSDSVRSFNKKQLEKMKNDPNHIPTVMDDSEREGDPIKLINLLESPADMQHMEMRNWLLDRISAKYGVTASFQKASGGDSGLSQSMEIEVSNRSADRLRKILTDSFVTPLLRQMGVNGWGVSVAKPEEEDEVAEADLRNKHLQMGQMAAQLGLEAEWTSDNRVNIKAGEIEAPEEGGEGGGLGAMLGDDGPGGGDGTGPVPGDGEDPNGVTPEQAEDEDQGMQPGEPSVTDLSQRGDPNE